MCVINSMLVGVFAVHDIFPHIGFCHCDATIHTFYVFTFLSRYDGTSDLATVESYDPITNAWQPEVSMGTRRSCLGVAVLHGLLYAAGGYDGASCLNRYTRAYAFKITTEHLALHPSIICCLFWRWVAGQQL